jgi:dolichol-phosphate mannosyltransferase
VVVPTYNERGRLIELVEQTFGVFSGAGIDGQLVVVDDNSPDGTGALADDLAGRFHLAVVHRAGKLGLGTAVIEGFAAASGDIVGVMDADLSHPPELLPRMLRAIREEGADFVIGSRYVPGGGTRHWELSRRVMSRVACLLARPITPVRDATSGFFLVRREIAQGVRIQASGFKICLELLVRGRARSVVEVPYVFAGRSVGQSKMNSREAAGYLVQLRDLLRYRYSGPGRAARRTHRIMPPDGPVPAGR